MLFRAGKMIGGRTFCFQKTKTNSRDAAREAAAIGALWRQLKLQGHTVWREGRPNRIAIRGVVGTPAVTNGQAARKVARAGVGSLPPRVRNRRTRQDHAEEETHQRDHQCPRGGRLTISLAHKVIESVHAQTEIVIVSNARNTPTGAPS